MLLYRRLPVFWEVENIMLELFGKFTYITELLAAELIFLYSFPKRKLFPLRLIAVVLLIEVFWFLYSMYGFHMHNSFFAFFLMLAKIFSTIIGMLVCFKGPGWAIVSGCAGGVALQHIAYQASLLIATLPFVSEWNVYLEFIVCFVSYVGAYFLVGRSMKKNKYYENYDKRMIVISVVIVLICIGLFRFRRSSGTINLSAQIGFSLYAIMCNALALFIQFFWYRFALLKSDYLVLQRIREEEQKQYENSKANIELLNIKCHDLKHKLSSLETSLPQDEVDSMRKIIDAYDNTYKTGLDVLDVILNEKNIRCMSKGISLTCMGDGKALSFMSTMDLYSLFGNMLENAIEATERIADSAKKVISVVIEKKEEYVFINTVNYTEEKPFFEDGLPKTTKKGEWGYHGYGLKSIKNIAEKYQGGIAVSLEEGVFALNVYLLSKMG